MLIRRRLMLGAAAALLFAAPIANHAQQPADPPAPRVLDVAGGQIRVVTVATGLFHPWGLAFLPDGGILVSERNGRLRLIRDGKLLPDDGLDVSDAGRRSGRLAALRHPASEICRERPGLRLVPETGAAREHARRRARTPERRHARRGPGNLRRRRVGDERQPRGPHLLRPRSDALRHRRRSRSALLHGHRRQQPPDEGAVARQPRRQDPSPERRRHGAAGQPVRRQGRGEAGDLHVRPPQRVRARHPSDHRGAVAGRDRTDGRRRGQHPHRRVTTTAGRSSRPAATTRARSSPTNRGRGPGWTTRGSTGCRRSARRASCSTRATSFRTGRTTCSSVRSPRGSCSASRSASRRRRSGAKPLLLPLNIRVRDVQQSPDGYIYVVTEQASGRTGADGMVLRIEPNAAR